MIDTTLVVWETAPVFHLGDVVRKLRQDRKWTLDALSEQTGINKTTLSELERGGGNPRLDTLLKIAKAFGVMPEQLFPSISQFETAGDIHPEDDAPPSDNEVENEPDGVARSEAESLAAIYLSLRDVSSRRLLLEMAERFRAAEPTQPATGDSSLGSAPDRQATTDEAAPRIRKTRGA